VVEGKQHRALRQVSTDGQQISSLPSSACAECVVGSQHTTESALFADTGPHTVGSGRYNHVSELSISAITLAGRKGTMRDRNMPQYRMHSRALTSVNLILALEAKKKKTGLEEKKEKK
jgi:hypothetical protein